MIHEIWCEGDPRRDFTACHLGYGKGETIEQVCEDLANRSNYFMEHFNPYTLKYKGCSLFLSEAKARESHG